MSSDTASRQFASWADVHLFTFAGDATLTLVSRKSGERFTYRVAKSDPNSNGDVVYFVRVLSGPDNENDYQYIGMIDATGSFRTTKRSRVTPEAPSFKAFTFFLSRMRAGGLMSSTLEVWHEGRCGRCGRKLTVPESIARGIGPDCAGMMAVAA